MASRGPLLSSRHDFGACLSFYAWNRVDRFVDAWHKAAFHITGHVIFTKKYASGERFTCYQDEQAYLLTNRRAMPPCSPLPDVIPWSYNWQPPASDPKTGSDFPSAHRGLHGPRRHRARSILRRGFPRPISAVTTLASSWIGSCEASSRQAGYWCSTTG